MSLLLHHALHIAFRRLSTNTLGVDVSAKALRLARDNLNLVGLGSRQDSSLAFKQANVLAEKGEDIGGMKSVLDVIGDRDYDIIVANPPYISTEQFYTQTARSVRSFEPRLALVPGNNMSLKQPTAPEPDQGTKSANDDGIQPLIYEGDMFYPRIAEIARSVNAKLVLMEVGDSAQAERVANYFAAQTTTINETTQPFWHAIEIWCDGIAAEGVMTRKMMRCGTFHVPVVGPKEQTHGRTVVCWRGDAMNWLSTDCYIEGFWMRDSVAAAPWAFPVGSDFRNYSIVSGVPPPAAFELRKPQSSSELPGEEPDESVQGVEAESSRKTQA
jgi:methylase of polypeptide subunit release factors